ncbi:hypothetical protein D920_00350 [Enterococcus faecalis 13-SD-W-01]|nr:hypothetical protein D920_00350 [Enterococcus faecalis 13-SD-W-01]
MIPDLSVPFYAKRSKERIADLLFLFFEQIGLLRQKILIE